MPVTVRPADPAVDDFDAIGAITVGAYRSLPGFIGEPEYEAELADARTRSGQGNLMVAIADDGRVVGSLMWVPHHTDEHAEHDDPDAASFRMLAVDPARQGLGAGRALVEWCIAEARRLGRHRVIIHTTSYMVNAISMYERLGFVRRPDLDWRPFPELLIIGYELTL